MYATFGSGGTADTAAVGSDDGGSVGWGRLRRGRVMARATANGRPLASGSLSMDESRMSSMCAHARHRHWWSFISDNGGNTAVAPLDVRYPTPAARCLRTPLRRWYDIGRFVLFPIPHARHGCQCGAPVLDGSVVIGPAPPGRQSPRSTRNACGMWRAFVACCGRLPRHSADSANYSSSGRSIS